MGIPPSERLLRACAIAALRNGSFAIWRDYTGFGWGLIRFQDLTCERKGKSKVKGQKSKVKSVSSREVCSVPTAVSGKSVWWRTSPASDRHHGTDVSRC